MDSRPGPIRAPAFRSAATILVRLVLVALALVWPRAGHADEPIAIHYAAPEACPTANAFVQRVRERVPGDVQVAEVEAAARYRVVIAPNGSAFVGTLQGTARDGTPVQRGLTDASCSQLVSALALVTALSINPLSARPVDTAPVVSGPPPRGVPKLEPPRPQKLRRYEVRAGIGWDVLGRVAPSLGVVSADVSGGAVYRYSALVATTLQLGLLIGETWDEPRTDVRVSYRWLLARVGACPLELALGAAVRLATCAAWQIGDLRAVGSGQALELSQTAHLPWSSLEATLRAGLELLRPFWLELEGGVVLPLQTASFVVSAPQSLVYRTSEVGFLWRSGLILQFP